MRLVFKIVPVLAALGCLVGTGCRSPDVNPRTPRAKTGYVDFYMEPNQQLWWQVKHGTGPSGDMPTVFSEYDPLPGNILRLAAPPGTNRFEVWFYNQYTTGPKTVLVQVENGRITPVCVTLKASGSTEVNTTTYKYRATVRATRAVPVTVTSQQQTFEIDLAATTPRDYQPKERMPYFSPPAK
jgi:hypothetical protein